MRVSLMRVVLFVVIVSLCGAVSCKGNTPASLEPEGNLLAINIFNVPSAMQPGQVFAIGARGLYPGTATYTVTAYADWASSDLNVIEIIGKGILRAIGGGTATITCTYRGVTSQGVAVTVSGTPIPGTEPPAQVVLKSIQVTPTWASVPINGTKQFQAVAVYSNGVEQDITPLADWRVSDDDPGFIIDSDNANAWGAYYGLFKATGPVGTTVVSCWYMGVVSNYVTVVVREF